MKSWEKTREANETAQARTKTASKPQLPLLANVRTMACRARKEKEDGRKTGGKGAPAEGMEIDVHIRRIHSS